MAVCSQLRKEEFMVANFRYLFEMPKRRAEALISVSEIPRVSPLWD